MFWNGILTSRKHKYVIMWGVAICREGKPAKKVEDSEQ